MKRTIQSPTAVAAPIEKLSPPASVSLRPAFGASARRPDRSSIGRRVLLAPAELDSAIESR
jgi:hypothetical protein